MNELLDYSQAEEQGGKEFSEIVRWWEKKRLLYNAIILIFGLLNLFLANSFSVSIILPVLVYVIFANMFYCAGIMVEAWDIYYFGGKLNMANYRMVTFILGLLISIFITIFINSDSFASNGEKINAEMHSDR